VDDDQRRRLHRRRDPEWLLSYGDWFAVNHEGVIPDIVATAKGLAGGMPLAGVTGRVELMNAVHEGGLGGTYGGNPVACVAALATIKTSARPKLGRAGPRDR